MIVMRRSFLIAGTVIVGAMFLGLGVYGYRLIGTAEISAERFLYVAGLGALTSTILFLTGVFRAVALDNRLDRLISQGTRRDIIPGRDFAALGTLGKKLTTIYNQIGRQNVLKTRKISGMHDLIEFLVRNQDRAIAVCDVTGAIRYANEELAESVERNRIELIGENMKEILTDFSMSSLLPTLLQTRQPVSETLGGREFSCYPIEDRSGEPAYLVFLFDGKARFFEKRERAAGPSPRRPGTLTSALSRFFTRTHR